MKNYLGIRQSCDFIVVSKELKIAKENIEFELDYDDYDSRQRNPEPKEFTDDENSFRDRISARRKTMAKRAQEKRVKFDLGTEQHKSSTKYLSGVGQELEEDQSSGLVEGIQ